MFFVVHPDGSRYGPADLTTLQVWVAEGRLIASTPLIDATSGRHLLASEVQGLFVTTPPESAGGPLGGGPVYPAKRSDSPLVTAAYLLLLLSMVLTCCFPLPIGPIFGILLSVGGMGCGFSAKRTGSGGGGAIVLSVATLIVNTLAIVLYAILKDRISL